MALDLLNLILWDFCGEPDSGYHVPLLERCSDCYNLGYFEPRLHLYFKGDGV